MIADTTAPPPRSWLYLPASRIELLDKALTGPADVVVIDLEDAVPVSAKDTARAALAAATDQLSRRDKPVWVRINQVPGPWSQADIDLVAELPIDGVRLPKAEHPALVAEVAVRIGKPLHILVESALGLQNAALLAQADQWIAGIGLGEADLLADLGGSGPAALAYARGHIVMTARATGLGAPIMSVYTAINDLTGLAEDSQRARELGFFGRNVVHPKQVPVVNAAFTPSAAQIAAAEQIVAAMELAERQGRAAAVDQAGRFIDPAVLRSAREILALTTRDAGVASPITSSVIPSVQENST